MKSLAVEDLVRAKTETLRLEVLTAECDMSRRITSPTISSPGLVLAGFRERVPAGRIQVLGETEIRWLHSLEDHVRRDTVDSFLALDFPAVIVTKSLEVPVELIEAGCRHGVPIIRSALKTGEFYRRLQPYLAEKFAPSTTLHGSLADVYGVGLLFVGRSGIGKSECVLDLIERGHRLVADDAVLITRRGNDILLGFGHELQRHHMEIRGIGIIDVKALFGIRAIRQQKRVEVVVNLVDWDADGYYDRTGLESDEIDVLGVSLPRVTVPLNAGKNITVICEVVAMNHLLKYSGVHSAQLFNQRLQEAMRPVRQYLEEDYE